MKLLNPALVLLALAPFAEAGPKVKKVSEKNLAAWKKALQPPAKSTEWRKLGWETELWPAVRKARQETKPLLLWTMNGHPFGST